jgi:biopolymer transport protein ExbB/TolQ
MNAVTLSPVEFFMLAGPVGRVVILILAAASVWCWVLTIEGIVGVIRFRAALAAWRAGKTPPMLAGIAEAGERAAALRLPGEGIGDTRMRLIETMNRSARSVVSAIEGGLANLAVIASVSPFVGLFGTVWGIMSSFTSIAAAKDTSLATVAPGIAEALATTAIGLAAAIPASVAYTRIGSAITRASSLLASLIEEEALAAVTPNTKHHTLKEAG